MRSRLRRHRLALLALLCGGASAMLVLLALDARIWQTTISRDDMRFRALPAHTRLWQPQTVLPGDPASTLIGTATTTGYRRALQYFWFSHIGSNPEVPQDLPTLRASAQNKLQQVLGSAPDSRERSAAANLLGVLVVTTPAVGSDQSAIEQTLSRSAQYFQQAIALDPANHDAKENLEVVLRLTRPGKGKLGRDARAGYGFGKGQAVVKQGGGY